MNKFEVLKLMFYQIEISINNYINLILIKPNVIIIRLCLNHSIKHQISENITINVL